MSDHFDPEISTMAHALCLDYARNANGRARWAGATEQECHYRVEENTRADGYVVICRAHQELGYYCHDAVYSVWEDSDLGGLWYWDSELDPADDATGPTERNPARQWHG